METKNGPGFRSASGQWRATLNEKNVKAAFKEFFMLDGGRVLNTFKRLSATYHDLEKQDRTNDEKDFFLSICEPAIKAHDSLLESFQEGRHPKIDEYLQAYSMAEQANAKICVWMQVKTIFAESRGLSGASFVEVITKARNDLESMNKGRHTKKADALSLLLKEIVTKLYYATGKLPELKEVIKCLEDEKELIQDVIYDEENVYWKRKSGIDSKPTSFKAIGQRLTEIRKKMT